MKKPSYTYDEFKIVWTQLLQDNRASLDNAVIELGGSKGTASKYRAQYEVNQKEQAMQFMDSIELPEKVLEVLAGLNVKKVKTLEAHASELKTHVEEIQKTLTETVASFETEQLLWQNEQAAVKETALQYEREIAALEERLAERARNEAQLKKELSMMQSQLTEVTTKAAVAQKEVTLLKERAEG